MGMETYAAYGIAPLLRIPEISAALATAGIIAPYVETIEQVRTLIGAVKLRPLKGQRLRHWLQENSSPPGDTPDYLRHFNRDNVLVIMMEFSEGIDNLSELLIVEGVHAVLVGHHDLSISLGIPK